jgi:DNA-binding NtrC family response regulator
MPRVLIADDQQDVLEALCLLLKGERFETVTVTSPEALLRKLETGDFDALLIDLNYTRDTTSGQEGLDLLSRIRKLDSTMPVIVMTAWGSVELAVEAMRRGANDFLRKPWDNERLLSILRTQVELGRAVQKGQRLEAENTLLRRQSPLPTLIAEDPSMRPVLDLISRIGPSEANVLITGANGTGKDVVARTLHAMSPRSSKPMITVNAGGLSEGTLESELFGHVKGAYTDAKTDRVGRFELADGGTLFLDEVANASHTLQTKLLRVLETGEFERVGSSKTRHVNARVLSATNANLAAEVGAGRFRQDLFFRLNTVEIRLPPLVDRKQDIPLLAQHFLRESASRYQRDLEGFSAPAMDSLMAHSWPGNIRELRHVVERAVLMAQGAFVNPADLGLEPTKSVSVGAIDEMSLEDVERLLIKKALLRFSGNANKAAEALGLSRSALYRRLQKYGL